MKNKISKGLLRRWLFPFSLVAASIVLYKSFDRLSDVFVWLGSMLSLFTPFLAAFAIAYFLNRPVAAIERGFSKPSNRKLIRKHSRGFAVTIVYILFISLIVLLGYAIIPSIISGITSLVENSESYLSRADAFFGELSEKYSFMSGLDVGESVLGILRSFIAGIEVSTVVGYLKSIGDVGSVLANVAVSLFVSVYMLLERETIMAAINRICSLFMKDKTRTAVKNYLMRSDKVVYKYFVGQFMDCIIVSIMATIALLFMNTPSPVLLGFVFGMFNIIPYFGPIIGGVFVVLVILLSRGFGIAITATIVLLVLQQIDANVINPMILGGSLDMSPFWVILAITVGGGLFDFVGMLLGVPLMAVIRMIYRDLLSYKRRRKLAAQNATANAASEVPFLDYEAIERSEKEAESRRTAPIDKLVGLFKKVSKRKKK